jgi:hypothetical protein
VGILSLLLLRCVSRFAPGSASVILDVPCEGAPVTLYLGLASFPNLGNDGNRLVGVDPTFAFPWILWGLPSSVYLGFTLQGYKLIDRRSLVVI